MMRLRAGSGGGYACRVQRRKALAAEAEAGGSSVWNRELSCDRFLRIPMRSTVVHDDEYHCEGNAGGRAKAAWHSLKELKKESPCTQTTLLHRF